MCRVSGAMVCTSLVQVGACVPVGRLQTDDLDQLADVADRYSNGEVRITCEENVIFPNVANADVEALAKEPIFERFEINPGNIMRGLVSCTGSQFCGFGLVETKNRQALLPLFAACSSLVLIVVCLRWLATADEC
jgi:ferredoxin-nitrite reductase